MSVIRQPIQAATSSRVINKNRFLINRIYASSKKNQEEYRLSVAAQRENFLGLIDTF